jgi:alpha-1,3-rhamnosyl/mannosyltransferase
MTIKVGFGTTLIERGRAGGKLDGIGVYASQLLNHLPSPGTIDVLPVSFPRKPWEASRSAQEAGTTFGCAYGIAAAIAATTGLAFPGARAIARRVDVFHAPDHLIPKMRSVPVVATICDALPVKRPDWINAGPARFRSRLAKAAAAWADHVIAISAAMVPDLVQFLGIAERSISVVHPGVGDEWFEPVPEADRRAVLEQYELQAGYFLFVGTLQPRKNVQTIVDAWLALSADLRAAHPLVIAGQPGWGAEPAVERVRAAAGAGCRWLEYVPAAQLRALYQNATAFVFPSLWEGFGMPVLEAFASGVPVISSNLSSLPEVAGDAALLVDPLSVQELRKAMAQLVDDTELCAELRRRGTERARRMSWVHCAAQTRDVYRKVLS